MASKMYKPKGKTDKQLAAETEADLRKIARETGAKRVAEIERDKAKPVGHLAKGLDAQNSPHSVKAIADAKRKAEPAKPVANRVAVKLAADAKRKAERAAKAAPKADDNRKIVIVDKKFSYGKEGTSRRASWDACVKAKTVAEYAAKGGALKYLPRWVAAGAIKLG